MLRKVCVFVLVTAAMVLPSAILAAKSGGKAPKAVGKFCPAFNGKDLSGWSVVGPKAWSVKDGELVCEGGHGPGGIETTKQYKNFMVRLEYKIQASGNSGVFVRSGSTPNGKLSGMEIQIQDDLGRGPNTHTTGGLYGYVATSVNATKRAGEWNKMQISCIGSMIRVWVNGVFVLRVDISDAVLNSKLPEGEKLTKWPKVGHIGIQNHNQPAEFRNVEILEM